MKLRRKQQRAIEWALTTEARRFLALALVSGSANLGCGTGYVRSLQETSPFPGSFQVAKNRPEQKLRLFNELGRVCIYRVACVAGRLPSRGCQNQQQNAARLRSRCGAAVDREGFPAGSAIALRDTTYREGARRRTVVEVPARQIVVPSLSLAPPRVRKYVLPAVKAAGKTGHMVDVNVETEAIASEEGEADSSPWIHSLCRCRTPRCRAST